MRKLSMFLLLAGILPVSGVHADGSLQGLEMDVMEADESPSQATARIALPGASPMVKDGKADDADLVTGPPKPGSTAVRRLPSRTRPRWYQRPQWILRVTWARKRPITSTPALRTSQTAAARSSMVEALPRSPHREARRRFDGGPGDVGIIEPVEGPIDDVPVEEPPVDGEPIEIPIGELPGDDTPVDEPPGDGIPIDDVDGDPTGGGGVVGDPGDGGGVDGDPAGSGEIEPMPMEVPGDTGEESASSARADRS